MTKQCPGCEYCAPQPYKPMYAAEFIRLHPHCFDMVSSRLYWLIPQSDLDRNNFDPSCLLVDEKDLVSIRTADPHDASESIAYVPIRFRTGHLKNPDIRVSLLYGENGPLSRGYNCQFPCAELNDLDRFQRLVRTDVFTDFSVCCIHDQGVSVIESAVKRCGYNKMSEVTQGLNIVI